MKLPGLSLDEVKRLIMSVGTHAAKRPYTPVEVGGKFMKAVRAGATLEQCAQAVQLRGTSMVSRFLRLIKLHSNVQHLIDWGQSGATISFTSAWRLTQLSTVDQVPACNAILQHQLTSPEVEQLIQLRRRSGKSIAECTKAVLRMRPVIERRHVFIGAVTSDQVRTRLVNMLQDDRDELLRKAVRRCFPKLRGFASRLGAERFTIVVNQQDASVLTHGRENFEAAINAVLQKARQI